MSHQDAAHPREAATGPDRLPQGLRPAVEQEHVVHEGAALAADLPVSRATAQDGHPQNALGHPSAAPVPSRVTSTAATIGGPGPGSGIGGVPGALDQGIPHTPYERGMPVSHTPALVTAAAGAPLEPRTDRAPRRCATTTC